MDGTDIAEESLSLFLSYGFFIFVVIFIVGGVRAKCSAGLIGFCSGVVSRFRDA